MSMLSPNNDMFEVTSGGYLLLEIQIQFWYPFSSGFERKLFILEKSCLTTLS